MIWPLFLDVQPDYMRGCRDPTSLLLGPVGARRLVSLLQSSVGPAAQPPVVLPLFPVTDAYVSAVQRHCEGARIVPLARFESASYDASDWLLFMDPRWYCVEALRITAMLRDSARLQARATHLVAMARHAGGTHEQIETGADGRVRTIHRYYDSATWPQLAGVACSLISVACFRTGRDPLAFTSLMELRHRLSERGVPSRDVSIQGSVFDLSKAGELLRLNEQMLVAWGSEESHRRQSRVSATIHPTARLLGTVVVHDDAVIEEGATVVGHSVIGRGARVGARAVVAQSIVGDGVTIPASSVVAHRAVFADWLDAALPPDAESICDDSPASEYDTSDRTAIRPFYSGVKAVVDSAIAALSLLVLSPLFALIAVLIKLDSRGSVFFCDLREGCAGELFRCWKFRTMHEGSNLRQRDLRDRNDVDGPQFKLERDPRLTRVGRWLRPMSLDELPQLFNVLRGEMSLIGPRPSPFGENQLCVPWRDARLSVRPGITGLWQVCRSDRPGGDFHQWVYFDLLYVQHMSFWLDVKILLATILTRGGQKNVRVDRLIPVPRLRT